uniref:Uncharacterized protein n=1 Tax=Oryza sativa subsp. japonica TaxID=39947 RepID=Q60F32_ORYSJ|nr:hypothetical protein [Oryza sativa Japonica Group]
MKGVRRAARLTGGGDDGWAAPPTRRLWRSDGGADGGGGRQEEAWRGSRAARQRCEGLKRVEQRRQGENRHGGAVEERRRGGPVGVGIASDGLGWIWARKSLDEITPR